MRGRLRTEVVRGRERGSERGGGESGGGEREKGQKWKGKRYIHVLKLGNRDEKGLSMIT